ncbi:hypothetical protein U2083_14335, partial [Listeria monocytogenes]|uniref:hypothetical protein n=1 Tax=Listeria monocytogenes TaxID=1639 RepID=UPI002FDC639D
TAEQKLQEQLDALTKERDDAKALATAAEEKRIVAAVDGELKGFASKAGAQFPIDVIEYARKYYADKVTALMADDGKVDEKKAG